MGSFFVSLYLRWECGQALAKPAFKWQKSLSLNILSLKKPSSRKNICETWANDEVRSGWKGGSSCRRVRVSPPRVSRNKTSGFSCSNWPLCERPGRKRMRAHLYWKNTFRHFNFTKLWKIWRNVWINMKLYTFKLVHYFLYRININSVPLVQWLACGKLDRQPATGYLLEQFTIPWQKSSKWKGRETTHNSIT